MKNQREITGVLRIVKWFGYNTKANPTIFGNPRALIEITYGDNKQYFKTMVNSMFAYEVSNYDGEVVKATVGDYYRTPTISKVKRY